jgi:hypothetical protein
MTYYNKYPFYDKKLSTSSDSCSPLNPYLTEHKGLRYLTEKSLSFCDSNNYKKNTYCNKYDELIIFKFILHFLENSTWLDNPIVSYRYIDSGSYGHGIEISDKNGKKYMCKLLKCKEDNSYENIIDEVKNNIIFNKYDSPFFNKFYLAMFFNHPDQIPMIIYPKYDKLYMQEYPIKSINSIIEDNEINISFIITDMADGDLDKLFLYKNNKFQNLEIENFEEGLILIISIISNLLIGLSMIHNEGYGHFDIKEPNITFKKIKNKSSESSNKNNFTLQFIDLSSLIKLDNNDKIQVITYNYALELPSETTVFSKNPLYKRQYDIVSLSRIFINLVLFITRIFLDDKSNKTSSQINNDEYLENPYFNYLNFLNENSLEDKDEKTATINYNLMYEYIRDKLNEKNYSKLYRYLFRKIYYLLADTVNELEKIESVSTKINILCGIIYNIYKGYDDSKLLDRNLQRLIKKYFSGVIKNIIETDILSEMFLSDEENNITKLKNLLFKSEFEKVKSSKRDYLTSFDKKYKYNLGKLSLLFNEEKLEKIKEKIKNSKCPAGKIINPLNGKCDNVNSSVINSLIEDKIIEKIK